MMWLFASLSLAQAADPVRPGDIPNGTTGVLVGLGSVGGALVGGLGGGAVGFAVGSASCANATFECWAPLVGVGVGGAAGAAVGSFVGAGATAGALDRKVGRALLGSCVGLASGVAVGALGAATDSSGLAIGGILIATAGVPIGGGIAAATEGKVSLAPEATAGYRGVRLSARF